MAKQPRQQPPPPTDVAGPAPWLRALLSLLVVWHLFVVFVSPFSVPPTSQLVVDLAQSKYVRWYSEPLYLNHGYHFFGPEPPINQLVRYSVVNDSGALIAEGEFPDKRQQWPRLFYHRHMMLADQASLGPPDVAPEAWLRVTLRAYARNLLRRHGGAEVRLDYVRHNLLYPDQSRRGDDPNAPEMFTRVLSLRETTGGLEQSLGVPAAPDPTPPSAAQGETL